MANFSTRVKIILLVFGSLAFLAIVISFFTSRQVREAVSERLRENSANAVRLSASNAHDMYLSLFREKLDRVMRLKEVLSIQEKSIRSMAGMQGDFFALLRGVYLPDGFSLWVINQYMTVHLRLGDISLAFNPFSSVDIKGLAVGSNMLRLARQGFPATALVQSPLPGEGGKKYFGKLFFLPLLGYLVGLWVDLEAQEDDDRRNLFGGIKDLAATFDSVRLGDSGFLMVVDAEGAPIILPSGNRLVPDLAAINPASGQALLADVKVAAGSAERFFYGRIADAETNRRGFFGRQETGSREMLAFVEYVRPLKWYVIGISFVDEIERTGNRLALSLMVSILGISFFLAAVVMVMVGRLTEPLAKLAGFARKLPESNFLNQAGDNVLLKNISRRGKKDEIGELARTLLFMDEALRARVRELLDAASARERMEGELRAATQIQVNFLPKPLSPEKVVGRFKLAADLIPAREVGGDLYDFFLLDNDHLCLVIGDVSGKGVPAALFMSMTHVLIRSGASLGVSPGELLADVNRKLSLDNTTNMFVTLFVAIIDLQSGEMSFANAGHNAPLLASPSGVRRLDEPAGVIAGVMEDLTFDVGTLVLHPDEALLLYTDGVSEAMNAAGDLFGDAALDSVVASCNSEEPEEMIRQTLVAVARHVGDAPPSDDITILCFRFA